MDNPSTPIFKCTNCGYPNPVIRSAGMPAVPAPASAKPAFGAPQARFNEVHQKPVSKPQELGWLVVHDENAPPQTHALRIGRQVIGRKSMSKPCDVMIDTADSYMGRNHCIIEVKPNRSGGYEFFLSDVKMTNGIPEQMSTNGTFINAAPTPLKPKDLVYLNDGDTIQIGQTKVVLKTLQSSVSADEAKSTVEGSDYMPTVILR